MPRKSISLYWPDSELCLNDASNDRIYSLWIFYKIEGHIVCLDCSASSSKAMFTGKKHCFCLSTIKAQHGLLWDFQTKIKKSYCQKRKGRIYACFLYQLKLLLFLCFPACILYIYQLFNVRALHKDNAIIIKP